MELSTFILTQPSGGCPLTNYYFLKIKLKYKRDNIYIYVLPLEDIPLYMISSTLVQGPNVHGLGTR